MGSRSGLLADVQAGHHNSTAHAKRFFPPKMLKQTTFTSFGDVTDTLLMYIGVGIKGSAHETGGFLVLVSQFGSIV